LQLQVSPDPGQVSFDCGYGKIQATPSSYTPTNYILQGTGTSCISNLVTVYIAGNEVVSDYTSGTSTVTLSPLSALSGPATYSLTWQSSSAYYLSLQLVPNPPSTVISAVWFDCGNGITPTQQASYNHALWILQGVSQGCPSTTTKVYINSATSTPITTVYTSSSTYSVTRSNAQAVSPSTPSSSGGFFSNTAAVAVVFSIVGIIVIAGIIVVIFIIYKRKRPDLEKPLMEDADYVSMDN
jgi:hypothetical protein